MVEIVYGPTDGGSIIASHDVQSRLHIVQVFCFWSGRTGWSANYPNRNKTLRSTFFTSFSCNRGPFLCLSKFYILFPKQVGPSLKLDTGYRVKRLETFFFFEKKKQWCVSYQGFEHFLYIYIALLYKKFHIVREI